MHKDERQSIIKGLIEAESFGSQLELTKRLKKLGVSVTQASVSRDLDELGIVKVHGVYANPARNGREVFGPVTFQTAGSNLIVAKTLSGLASAVTVRIDSAGIPEIVGTIAGDDTIFIAVRDQKSGQTALKKVTGVFS